MLNERKRINSILGEGSSRREMANNSPLQGGGRSCACTSKLQMRGGGSSRRDILKKPTLQSWYRQYKLGSGV